MKHTIHDMAACCRRLARKIEECGYTATERLHENANAIFAASERIEQTAQKPQEKKVA